MEIKFFKQDRQSQQGISLYLAFMIMTVLLAIALGISAIAFGQIKTIKSMGDSVIALYAADTGTELVLNNINPKDNCKFDLDPVPDECKGVLDNGATYSVKVYESNPPPSGNCSGQYYCIRAVGIYNKTKRAIETAR